MPELQWYLETMRATIDAGGRVVVPKPVRDRLGLRPGGEVELIERDGWLEVAPAPTPMSLVETQEGLVASAGREMPVLTAEMVRASVEQQRR